MTWLGGDAPGVLVGGLAGCQLCERSKEYMRIARVSDGPLFPSTHLGDRYERLTPRTVRRLIRQALGELGVDKTTHGFAITS
jgi:integrase